MGSFKRIRPGLRAIIILAIRGAIVALVSLPILVFAVQVQERLLGAPPPQVVAFLIGFVFAKLALLVLLGRMLDRVDPITTQSEPDKARSTVSGAGFRLLWREPFGSAKRA